MSARPKTKKQRVDQANRLRPILEAEYPDMTLSLDFTNELELVVATILSAQCTDERVNQVTKSLFPKYPDAEAYAKADPEELQEDIRSTGFFRNKAKSLQGMARMVVEDFGGALPRTMEELVKLPGVARKTANVVLSNAFGVNEGVVVDTHVKRVSHRLGLTDETDPIKVERDLMAVLPREEWREYPWRLILHGRRVCKSRKPSCFDCPLADLCPSAEA